MSFQATHLHFAQKVKDILKPQNLTEYFSGTLYPDSRYYTKVDRAKTHTAVRIEPQKILELTSDFEKGWQVHLWYDKLGLQHLYPIAINSPYNLDDLQKTEIWAKLTGAKVIEDLFWWQDTDWKEIIPCLRNIYSPNQEKTEDLEKWYQYFKNYYAQKPDLDSYTPQGEFMGIEPEKIELIMQSAHNLYNDSAKRVKIEQVMEQVVTEFKQALGR